MKYEEINLFGYDEENSSADFFGDDVLNSENMQASESYDEENTINDEYEEAVGENEDFPVDNDSYDNKSKKTAYPLKMRAKNNHIFLKVCLTLVGLCGILLTPLFNVKYITVKGTSYLTDQRVIEASGIEKKNIFSFQVKKACKDVEKLSFVDVANIKRDYPLGVTIDIKECKPVAKIACSDSLFLVVDGKGKILDICEEKNEYDVPVIERTYITEFKLGNRVKTEDESSFADLLKLANELNLNSMSNTVKCIYLKGNDSVVEFDNGILCNVGNGENLSYRVKFVKEALKSIPKGKKGTFEFIENFKAVFTENEE